MAKKRRTSTSPTRSGARQKRKRTRSASESTLNSGANTLPTSNDWVFRLKVLSSSHVDDDLLDQAVRGLVQICFPDGFLEELGVDVVEAHMREEGAAQNNIDRMKPVFHDAMTRQMAWLLAKYLDTPEKLEEAVSALATASQQLHGDKLGAETGEGEHNVASDASGEPSEPELETPPKKLNKKSKASDQRRKPEKKRLESNEDVIMDDSEPEAEIQPHCDLAPPETNRSKEKKVSTSWRWDINPAALPADNISNLFKKTSDLFAYHALPVVKHELGPGTERKAIRKRIEAILTDMPETQYEKWVESLQQLHNGDMSMLDRVSPDNISVQGDITRATPAPTTVQHRRGNRLQVYNERASREQQNASRPVVEQTPTHGLPVVGRDLPSIKREKEADVVEAPGASTGGAHHELNDVNATLSAFRHLSTEEPRSRETSQPHETPVIDLLWGTSRFRHDDRERVVHTIMTNLDKRVSADYIGVQQFDKETRARNKWHLRSALGSWGKSLEFEHSDVRARMEDKLSFWVIANPFAFPELKAEPLFFTYPMPADTVLLDIVDPLGVSRPPMKDRRRIKAVILNVFRYRISSDDLEIARVRYELEYILARPNADGVQKRGLLERMLRRAAFARRDKFPELMGSVLVRAWERVTGLRW